MNHIDTVKATYTAFATADRDLIESLLADDLVFSAPPDVGIDRATYFERCWPGAGGTERFDYVRLAEVGDEVLVTYEATRKDGTRFRNTEIFGFDGDRIASIEVYFGWDLTSPSRRHPVLRSCTTSPLQTGPVRPERSTRRPCLTRRSSWTGTTCGAPSCGSRTRSWRRRPSRSCSRSSGSIAAAPSSPPA